MQNMGQKQCMYVQLSNVLTYQKKYAMHWKQYAKQEILCRQTSFIIQLTAEQRRHVSCFGDGGNWTHAARVTMWLDPAFALTTRRRGRWKYYVKYMETKFTNMLCNMQNKNKKIYIWTVHKLNMHIVEKIRENELVSFKLPTI